MKTNKRARWSFFLFFAIIGTQSFCQQNTSILESYMRTWGIVKYWTDFNFSESVKLDSLFLKDINKLLNHNSRIELQNAINKLFSYSDNKRIPSQGPPIANVDCISRERISLWVESNPFFFKNIKNKLLLLIDRKSFSPNYFVQSEVTFNPLFINENKFLAAFPNTELRLLSIAKLWNCIYYFYPYYELIDHEWESAFEPYILKMINCTSAQDYHLNILSFANKIKDEHGIVLSNILENYYGQYCLPFKVVSFGDEIVMTSKYPDIISYPFIFGDCIKDINGVSFREFFEKDSINNWGSNNKRIKTRSGNLFLRFRDTLPVMVRIERGDSTYTFLSKPTARQKLATYDLINYFSQQDYIIGDDYTYLNISRIDSSSFESLLVNNKKPYIIMDLRNYPNWILNQISALLAVDKIPFATYSYPLPYLPGCLSKPINQFLEPKRFSKKIYYKKILILVNQSTISRGEYLCMALQALPRTITIGDNSAGADGNVSSINLPGNITVQFSGLRISYPDNFPTQQKGVKINNYYCEDVTTVKSGQDGHLQFVLKNFLK